MTKRALLHCNAGRDYGFGHLMRSLAVGEEAASRGWRVTLGGDLSPQALAIAADIVPGLDVQTVSLAQAEPWLIKSINELRPDVVHLDTYWLDATMLGEVGTLLSNMQDGAFGVRPADLVVDANVGANPDAPRKSARLGYNVGVDAALVRRQVQSRRAVRGAPHKPPRVLVVIGGTDARRLTARIVGALSQLPRPLELTVVCGADQEDAVRTAASGTSHRVTVHRFMSDLPSAANAHDIVISAAGTSVLDFACMGVPSAIVCAASNQRAGYRASTSAGLAIALGEPPYEDLNDRMAEVQRLLEDPGRFRALSERLVETVDGLGAWRLVSSWEQLLAVPPAEPPSPPPVLRPATLDDAQLLFGWRNDPATRAVSRSSRPVSWEQHTGWLADAIENPDLQLFVARNAIAESPPIGTVRWDRRQDGWEVSVTVDPASRGQRLALGLLQAGERALISGNGPARLLAAIHVSNEASRRLFARAGYLPHRPPDGAGFAWYMRYSLD